MPFKLSDEHIEFILGDIRARGVEMESLQQSLLDHICCILEEELENQADFEHKYEGVIRRFFEKDLSEIEKETKLLLKNRHYYTMKKALYILLFVSLGINVFMITNLGLRFFNEKKQRAKLMVNPEVNLQEGVNFLKAKIAEEYPDYQLRERICVMFLSSDVSPQAMEAMIVHQAEWEEISVDSARAALKLRQQEKFQIADSLAGAFPDVTFIAAFKLNNSEVKSIAKESKEKTRHLLYLDNMSTLYSGAVNATQKNKAAANMFHPQYFIVSPKGELLFYPKMLFVRDRIDKQLIDALKHPAP